MAGQRAFQRRTAVAGGSPVSWPDYLTSADFAQAVTENWQSEYLQFILFIVATIWLVQRGSNESKPLQNVGLESAAMRRKMHRAGRGRAGGEPPCTRIRSSS